MIYYIISTGVDLAWLERLRLRRHGLDGHRAAALHERAAHGDPLFRGFRKELMSCSSIIHTNANSDTNTDTETNHTRCSSISWLGCS